ncbi:MAG: hypothetical protein AAGG11_01200 [Pseudomonadota bacterium]
MSSSLDQLIALLEAELERLQANLETLRLTGNPARRQLERALVASIDERQTRLAELTALREQLDGNGDGEERG